MPSSLQQIEMLDQQMEEQQAMEEEMRLMEKSIPRHKRKFKGRTGGVTPNWADKSPAEERDIDEYMEARANKNELTLSKAWVESLAEKGFAAPIIKDVNADLSKMWFSQSNTDYIADLSPSGITNVEKAVFGSGARNNSRNKQETSKSRGNPVIKLPFEGEED